MNRIFLLLAFSLLCFFAEAQNKLYDSAKDVKYITVRGTDRLTRTYFDKVYFTKDKKLIRDIVNWKTISDRDSIFDDIQDTIYTITLFDKKKNIIDTYSAAAYTGNKLKYPQQIGWKYVRNKADSTTRIIDFFDTFFEKKLGVYQESLTRKEFEKERKKKNQLLFDIIGYINRPVYSFEVEQRLFVPYPGSFTIEYDFSTLEFDGESSAKVLEGRVRELLTEKVPDADFYMVHSTRSDIKRGNVGESDYFIWGFIIYSDKEFYDKVKDHVRIAYNKDWAEYKYNITKIGL